jgi:hypothetical protein
MHRSIVCALSVPAAVVLSAGSAVGQSAVEISEDGRRAAFPALEPAAEPGSPEGGGSVPFGTEPDFQIDLRRQVGGLAIADMNADGFNDIVVVCYISNSFPPYEDWREMIFYGTASGPSGTPGWISDNETHAGDVQIGDINGDTHPDMVVVRGGSVRTDPVQVYFGSPSGPATSPGFAASFARRQWGTAGDLVDIDDDGDLDVVTTGQGLSPDPFRPILLLRNNDGVLNPVPAWQSGAEEISNGVAHADLLGSDGLPELVTAKWVNFNSAVYENIGGTPGAFPFASVPGDDTDRGAQVGDVNGDGLPEVLFGGDPATLYRLESGALVPVWSASPPNGGTQDIRLHDIDGDGDLDVADVVFSSGRAYLYQNNNGVLDTTPTWTYDAPEVGTAIAFGDLNHDGRDDLVVGYSGNTCVRVFYAAAAACPADLAPPAGVLDLADVQAFIGGFVAQDPIADLAQPFGVFDLADVQAFVASFNAGCP